MSADRISERIRRQAAMASRAGQMAKLEEIAADVEELEAENEQLLHDAINAQETVAALTHELRAAQDSIARIDRRRAEAEAENARLRAVVEAALNLGETDGMRDGKMPYPDWWVLLDRALDPRHHPQVDVTGEAT